MVRICFSRSDIRTVSPAILAAPPLEPLRCIAVSSCRICRSSACSWPIDCAWLSPARPDRATTKIIADSQRCVRERNQPFWRLSWHAFSIFLPLDLFYVSYVVIVIPTGKIRTKSRLVQPMRRVSKRPTEESADAVSWYKVSWYKIANPAVFSRICLPCPKHAFGDQRTWPATKGHGLWKP